MYEYISGMVTKVNPKYIVVDNAGIGYQIFVPNPYTYHMHDSVTVWTYFQVREGANELYGFLTSEEKDMFVQLISVTGIGPKTALPILAASNVNDIKAAISNGDAKYMQKFPGIGPKAAQQIILDLRGKVDFDMKSLIINDNVKDAEEALIALGYNKKEVAKVMDKIDSNLKTDEIVKQGLKLLSKL